MTRDAARNYALDLEKIVDHKLTKWQKKPSTEHEGIFQFSWQWKQTRIILNVAWEEDQGGVFLQCVSPRISHEYRWSGLTDRTFNRVMDRVGNLAQTIMHPPIEPL